MRFNAQGSRRYPLGLRFYARIGKKNQFKAVGIIRLNTEYEAKRQGEGGRIWLDDGRVFDLVEVVGTQWNGPDVPA